MTSNNSWVKQLKKKKKKTLTQDSPDIESLLPPTAHFVYVASLGRLGSSLTLSRHSAGKDN